MDASLAPPPLTPTWTRLAVVLSVEQWSPQPLDESVLTIDTALAWAGCGHHERAEALLTLVQNTVADLWVSRQVGQLPLQAVDHVAEAVALLREASSVDHGVMEILADDGAGAGKDPPLADENPWAEGGAVGPPGPIRRAIDQEEVPVLVDPRLIYPRLLAWLPSGHDVTASAGAQTVLVRAVVSDMTTANAYELETLQAALVDFRTGQQVAHAPFSSADEDGVVTSIVSPPPTVPVADLLVTVANADLVAARDNLTGASSAGAMTSLALDDTRRGSERLTRWVAKLQVASGDPELSQERLLAEMLLPSGHVSNEGADRPEKLDPDFALTDADLERVVEAWSLTFDFARALTRTEDTTPTLIDLRHSEITHDSRCAGGELTLRDLAAHGVHPRITWRYCANPSALTVLAQPLQEGSAPEAELQLRAGRGWVPFAEDEDGNLAAHTQPESGGEVSIRVVRRNPR